MRMFLALCLLFASVVLGMAQFNPIQPNYFTTNVAPVVGGATNGIQINGGVGTNNVLYGLTVVNPVNVSTNRNSMALITNGVGTITYAIPAFTGSNNASGGPVFWVDVNSPIVQTIAGQPGILNANAFLGGNLQLLGDIYTKWLINASKFSVDTNGNIATSGNLLVNGSGVITGNLSTSTNYEGTNLVSHFGSGLNATAGYVPTADGNGNATWAAGGSTSPATLTNSGTISSNLFVYSSTKPYTSQILPYPIAVNSWLRYGPYYSCTNFASDVAAYVSGSYPALHQHPFAIWMDDGMFASYRDGNGNLTLNTNYWGAAGTLTNTISYWANYAHTNGCLIGFYTEDRNTTDAGSCGSDPTNFLKDANYLVSQGVDCMKMDPNAEGPTTLDLGLQHCALFDSYFRAAANTKLTYFFHDIGITNLNLALYSGIFAGTGLNWYSELQYSSPFACYSAVLLRLDDIYTNHMFFSGNGNQTCAFGFIENTFSSSNSVPDTMVKMAATMGLTMQFNLLSAGDPATQNYYYTNTELMNIACDPLHYPPQLAVTNGSPTTYQIWSRPLADGSLAVCLLNRTTNSTQTITVNWSDIGYPANQLFVIKDVISGAYIATNTSSFTTNQIEMQCQLLHFFPITQQALNLATNFVTMDATYQNVAGQKFFNNTSDEYLGFNVTLSGPSAAIQLNSRDSGPNLVLYDSLGVVRFFGSSSDEFKFDLNTGTESLSGLTNADGVAGQFWISDANKRMTPTLNGGSLTNLNLSGATGTFTGTINATAIYYPTNQGYIAPVLTNLMSALQSNNVLVLSAPVGFDTTRTNAQSMQFYWKNTGASVTNATVPAGWVITGTPYCTNVTAVLVTLYPNVISNFQFTPQY